MRPIQPGILEEVPAFARYMTCSLKTDADPAEVIQLLKPHVDGMSLVAGFGDDLIRALHVTVPLLHDFPDHSKAEVTIPSTPSSLWLWFRGDTSGEVVLESRKLRTVLEPAFEIVDVVDAFKHGIGQDLTGYEDGTENPEDEEALDTGFAEDGSSYVAVQKWVHDFSQFNAMSTEEQDLSIGRQISDNEEIEDAPNPHTLSGPNRKALIRMPSYCGALCPGRMRIAKASTSWHSAKIFAVLKYN